MEGADTVSDQEPGPGDAPSEATAEPQLDPRPKPGAGEAESFADAAQSATPTRFATEPVGGV